MGIINNNTRALSAALFLDPAAREIRGVTIQGNFLYSLWQKGTTCYAILLHMKNSSEPLSLDSGFAGKADARVAMFQGSGPGRLVKVDQTPSVLMKLRYTCLTDRKVAWKCWTHRFGKVYAMDEKRC